MTCPFPGMDPFLESQLWQDFHAKFLPVLGEMLTQQVVPRYFVEVEQYVYLAREEEEPDRLIEPDLALVDVRPNEPTSGAGGAAATATLAPVVHTMYLPRRRRRQTFLAIRDRSLRKVVTAIELLSPSNKSPGDDRNEYLVKRTNILCTMAHLVELDLLRGGQRLPTREPLERADFYAFISRHGRLPKVDVYLWTLRDKLPRVPIPLADGDPDAYLDLQAAFTTTYDRTRYDYALDYRAALKPPLDAASAEWVRGVLER